MEGTSTDENGTMEGQETLYCQSCLTNVNPTGQPSIGTSIYLPFMSLTNAPKCSFCSSANLPLVSLIIVNTRL